jgi:hypothetical protein
MLACDLFLVGIVRRVDGILSCLSFDMPGGCIVTGDCSRSQSISASKCQPPPGTAKPTARTGSVARAFPVKTFRISIKSTSDC